MNLTCRALPIKRRLIDCRYETIDIAGTWKILIS